MTNLPKGRRAIYATPLIVPKSGTLRSECEDVGGVTRNAACLADGCSTSIYSGLFSKMLVTLALKSRVLPRDPRSFAAWVNRVGINWRRSIPSVRITNLIVRDKIRRGAHSTFAALRIDACDVEESRFLYSLHHLGDTVFVHERSDRLLVAFPGFASDFGDSPPLLSTSEDYNLLSLPHLRCYCGTFLPGDRWFLFTDALGLWFFRELDRGGKPWRELAQLDLTNFREFVLSKREASYLRDDDTSLIHGRIPTIE